MRIKLFLLIILSIGTFLSLGDYSWANGGSSLFGVSKIDKDLQGGGANGNNIVDTIQNIIIYVVGLLYFIALAFGLWGGFLVLTSGGDDERVKKGKKVIIYMAVGLIIIFLASTFVKWLIEVFTKDIN